ncbi:TAXI family TRAP transporter solute-binding subunit [Paraburkholderia caribensis]|uniref:TAXI family TRAP transporter solute-binding subunit n=1 Tax=Paraburkholderia caribensis TaxID=75105 RepID=UPI00071FF7D8|nr:TAXI family TRAP transporter solute-binding subunit [Paraburkholderia caribensis]ALP62145.1 C4-dicarboxylate ABC transporter substrate-binding protein [Paraburkholderia caribensis]AUT52626.1 C4-dicarboxylate ABC transporter substrate-binding protein [Paraburkholderia caribensis]
MKPSDGRRPERPSERKPPHLVARFVAISWRDLAVSFGPILIISAIAIYVAVRLIQPAPPNTLTMAAGPKGSTFWVAAQKYKEILARNRITLNVLETEGSLDNYRRLADPHTDIDVGFVQDGIAPSKTTDDLMSLGSVSYVPVAIFYRGPMITLLSEFKGKRIAIGAEGSGTRELALQLLKANGITPDGPTKLLPLSGDDAAKALTEGKIDAAILTGDSAQPPVMGKLYRTAGVQFYDFTQAPAYAKRFPYLTQLEMPMGSFDLGKNLPSTTLHMIAPTAELVARDSLHPALSDLLIDAAHEVHGKATALQRAGEFPAPLAHDFPISEDAARYYKSGKSFLYRVLPFWLASLADRLLVVLVPIIVVLIPGLRLVPSLYAWRVKSRIYRWYGALIAIEREALNETSAAEREALIVRLDKIEESVNGLKMPLAYADQFYVLREHIGFVRARLTRDSDAASTPHRAAAAAEGPAAGRAEARAAMHESHAAQAHHDNPESHSSDDSETRPGSDHPARTS